MPPTAVIMRTPLRAPTTLTAPTLACSSLTEGKNQLGTHPYAQRLRQLIAEQLPCQKIYVSEQVRAAAAAPQQQQQSRSNTHRLPCLCPQACGLGCIQLQDRLLDTFQFTGRALAGSA